jgi:thioredoxin reductase (NADPH)
MDRIPNYDVVIVGGGPAGLPAGLSCQRAALRTVLYERGLVGGQIAISKEVENYPGVEGITGFELAEKLRKHAQGFGLTIVQEEVASIEPGDGFHDLRLANGDRVRTTALILAAGGSVRKLGVPGEAEYLGSGVSYCATCDGFFFRYKDVVVVGGGDTAVEEAVYLAKLCRTVTVVHRGRSFRASQLLQNRLAAEPKISVIWNSVVRSIDGNGSLVERVVIEDLKSRMERALPADGVFIFIGYDPNNSLVPPQVRTNELGFVITDEKCATNVPGIFACGDLRQKFATQIVIAAGDGAVAALAASRYVELRKVQTVDA